MTNDQNATPERIWTWPNAVHPDAGSWVSDSHHKDDDCGQHEYIRADIYEAVVNDRNRLRLELDYAKRQLAQCRREALELAARICDGYAAHHIKCRENVAEDDIHSQLAFEYRAHGADDCAEEIRKLIEKEGGW